ncbi:MAG: hypothetical protein ACRCXZ_04265 [Patescibacteria group bacterium]
MINLKTVTSFAVTTGIALFGFVGVVEAGEEKKHHSFQPITNQIVHSKPKSSKKCKKTKYRYQSRHTKTVIKKHLTTNSNLLKHHKITKKTTKHVIVKKSKFCKKINSRWSHRPFQPKH